MNKTGKSSSNYDPAEEQRQIARVHAAGRMWSPDKPEGVPVKVRRRKVRK